MGIPNYRYFFVKNYWHGSYTRVYIDNGGDVYGKILFINFSLNKEGNTFSIGEKNLEGKDYDVMQMSDHKLSQYGHVFADVQIKEVFDKIKE